MFSGERTSLDSKGIRNAAAHDAAVVAAISRVMAVIEFTPRGNILNANTNFCKAMGYDPASLVGRHHRLFVDSATASSDDYVRFWDRLSRGEFVAGEIKRVASGNRTVWLQASYNPIKDRSGQVVQIVKFATDITGQKLAALDSIGQIEAINRSQAVIHFDVNGIVLEANDNFCRAIGYDLEEIRGQHHRIFMQPEEAASREYTDFWARLRLGEFQQAEFMRIAKGGRQIWIQATYNPIRDPEGNVLKIVKFATDITATVEARMRNARLASDIEGDISTIVTNVGSVSEQTSEVASASANTSKTIATIALSTEQLMVSINDISGNVETSNTSMARASELARSADSQTTILRKTTEQMTGIVELIDDIASQINLLALNATIESARAGEAGRGFAVVASEVKQLASQVSSATRTIATEIRDVQNVSADVIGTLKAIQEAVDEVTTSISSVATAVAEQSGATSEISSTMRATSDAITSIDQLVGSIAVAMSDAKQSAGRAADQVRTNIQAMVNSR